MTEEGKLAIKFVQERGFDVKAYSPEQASLITKALKTSSLGLLPVEDVEKFLPLTLIEEADGIKETVKALEERIDLFAFRCETIKTSLGDAHYELFLKRGLKNSGTRYFNMMAEAIMYGVVPLHTPLLWADKALIVKVFESQGWEAAEDYAANLCRKKIAAERG